MTTTTDTAIQQSAVENEAMPSIFCFCLNTSVKVSYRLFLSVKTTISIWNEWIVDIRNIHKFPIEMYLTIKMSVPVKLYALAHIMLNRNGYKWWFRHCGRKIIIIICNKTKRHCRKTNRFLLGSHVFFAGIFTFCLFRFSFFLWMFSLNSLCRWSIMSSYCLFNYYDGKKRKS